MASSQNMLVLLSLLSGLAVFALVLSKKPRLPYPPGPPPKPFIGNALDVPSDIPWIKYLEWSKRLNSTLYSLKRRFAKASIFNTLGDIIHMSALGKHIVVLHKKEDMTELMEKRSRIYSNRPWIPVTEL